MRLLPELTPANEWSWTSGADGRLRLQGCRDCPTLVHPPVPICPSCRSRRWEPEAVHVGQGVAVRFAQHEDVWLPLFEPAGETRDNPVGDPAPPAPRPPLRDHRFQHRAVLSGIGRSALGRRPRRDPLSLTIDAWLEAVAQLRREAGKPKVTGAPTASVGSGGGTPPGVLLLRRDGA